MDHQEIAIRIGLDWTYTSAADVFAEMRMMMPSLTGITWDRLERESAVTYPCDDETSEGHSVIFGEGFPPPRPGAASWCLAISCHRTKFRTRSSRWC